MSDPTPVQVPEPDGRTIHERMAAILAELPAIGKNQRNQAQNFNFRGIDDVLNALNPLLAKHGVFYLPEVLERSTSERLISNNRVMFEVSLHVRYTFFGLTGDNVVASAWGEGTDMGDKSTPKAMTSAMKSALFQAFAISTEETADPDHGSPEESSGTRRGRQEPPPDAGGDDDPVADDETLKQVKDRIDALPEAQKAELRQRWMESRALAGHRPDNLTTSKVGLVLSLLNGAEAAARATGGPEAAKGPEKPAEAPQAGDEPAPGIPAEKVKAIEDEVKTLDQAEVDARLAHWTLPTTGAKDARRKRLVEAMVRDLVRQPA